MRVEKLLQENEELSLGSPSALLSLTSVIGRSRLLETPDFASPSRDGFAFSRWPLIQKTLDPKFLRNVFEQEWRELADKVGK